MKINLKNFVFVNYSNSTGLTDFWIRLKGFVIIKEKPGMICPQAQWVCIDYNTGHMYTGDTLPLLIKNMKKEWRDHSSFVGGI